MTREINAQRGEINVRREDVIVPPREITIKRESINEFINK